MVRHCLKISALVLASGFALSATARAQQPQPPKANQVQSNIRIPDLSGNWAGVAGCGWNPADPGCNLLEDGTPYQPWALDKLKSERPGRGPNRTFENTTDPYQKYCETYGLPRIYFNPTQFRFIQGSNDVVILYEMGPFWREVALNRKHPDDPDPTWWGDSIGWYEGDTLVVDTVGFNDRTWLDQVGRPHSDELHLIERYRRVDQEHLQLDVTFDDPKAYTKPWAGKLVFRASHAARYTMWVCDVQANQRFNDEFEKPTTLPPGPSAK